MGENLQEQWGGVRGDPPQAGHGVRSGKRNRWGRLRGCGSRGVVRYH